jgi:hypothetical protein
VYIPASSNEWPTNVNTVYNSNITQVSVYTPRVALCGCVSRQVGVGPPPTKWGHPTRLWHLCLLLWSCSLVHGTQEATGLPCTWQCTWRTDPVVGNSTAVISATTERFCKTHGSSGCMHAVGLFVFLRDACLCSASESAAKWTPAQTRPSDTRCLLLLAGLKAMCCNSSSQCPCAAVKRSASRALRWAVDCACVHDASAVLVFIVA